MIKNYQCLGCQKINVCKLYDIISKFSTDAKKQLEVDLQILRCGNYDGTGEVFNEEE